MKNSTLVLIVVYGANTPLGSRTMVCRLHSVEQPLLDAGLDALAEERAVGQDDRGPAAVA